MRGLRLGKRGLVVGMVALAAIAAAAVGPKAARAVERYRTELWRNGVKVAIERALHGEETVMITGRPESEEEEAEAGRKGERDDALVRQLAEAAWRGPETTAVRQQRLVIAAEEARRWPDLLPLPQRSAFGALAGPATSTDELTSSAGALVGQSAVSLGPANARFEWNGTQYLANDSGRPNAIRVDPRDAAVVYLATSGGGVWKTWQFGQTAPKWVPITETIGNLAIGAMDLDPVSPDTLWIGVGDFVDTAGGQLLRSTDGGATWSAPIGLSGGYPAGTGGTVTASRIRDLKISPLDGNHILVATEVGLFQSKDAKSASPSFQLVNLPNGANLLEEGAWTLAYLGAASNQSHWLASGVTGCAPGVAPPVSGSGKPVDATACPAGELGDLWRSIDSGATWTSIRAAGGLASALSAVAADGEIGRMALAAAPSTTPTSAVAYAQVSTVGGQDKQIGIFKSVNGGVTWTAVVKSTSVARNPTTSGDCDTLDLTHGQAWYNLAIGVDPGNGNNVLVGGNLCSARSTDGGAT